MRFTYILVLAFACSGTSSTPVPDVAVDSCPMNVVTGTVSNNSVTHTFGPIARAFEAYEATDDEWLLVVDEQPSPDGACATLPTTGFNLAFGFANKPTPGTYTIVLAGTGSAPTDCIAVAQQGGDANLAIASSGVLALTSVDASCLGGELSVTFGNDPPITGSFGAATCL
jgi:hypothetical protein